jgi:poly(3-hydroxybutyrate) depolymerase
MMLSMKQSSASALLLFGSLYHIGVSGCNTGPDALTTEYGKSIPQSCIEVPVGDAFEERCFHSFVPESCYEREDMTKVPLVVDIHGMGSCALYSAGYTGWMQKAEEECIVVVWPNGNENPLMPRCFNTPGFLNSEDIVGTEDIDEDNELTTMPCCCLDDTTLLPGKKAVDPLFVKMAIDSVVESFEANLDEELSIDTDRIYMAGHSNGCMMSLAMAALYSDTIAAVCCHAGSLTTPFPDKNYTPVPIWMIHGMKDGVVPYDGKTMLDLPGMGPLGFLSMNQTLRYLADQNDCVDEEEVAVEDENGVIGTIYKRTNCRQNADVEIVALFDGGHSPYKTPVFGEYTTIDTTAMAWEFCSAHTKGQPEPVFGNDESSSETMEETQFEDQEIGAVASSESFAPPTPRSSSLRLLGALLLAPFVGTIVGAL